MRQIDADELIDELSLVYDIREAEDYPYNIGVMAAIAKVKQRPTIEPKKGKWIEENRRPKSSAFYCSVCHRTAYDPQNHRSEVPKRCRYAYCPNCGAKMESE